MFSRSGEEVHHHKNVRNGRIVSTITSNWKLALLYLASQTLRQRGRHVLDGTVQDLYYLIPFSSGGN